MGLAIEKIILGTAQLGLKYGINNLVGEVSTDDAISILNCAYDNGIRVLDTASGYGDAEKKIGIYHTGHKSFRVNTKFDKIFGLDWEQSVRKSIENLNIPTLEVAMFHSYESYVDIKHKLPDIILKGKGRYFKSIGVSVYTNEELEKLIYEENVDTIQLPFNLLDNESQRGEVLRRLKEKGKTIHVRSVFLQGLFYKNLIDLPVKLLPLRAQIAQIHDIVTRENIGINELAIQYALSKEYIDGVLIGVDSKAQLLQNTQAVKTKVDSKILEYIDKIEVKNKELLNPSKW